MALLLFQLFFLWILLMNSLAFFLMWLDKRRAQSGEWRISERHLFLAPLLGGALGGILGMRIFRHKTRHWYFVWGLPAILVAQLWVAIYVYCRFYP